MIISKSPAQPGLFIFLMFIVVSCTSSYQKLATSPVQQVNEHVLSSKEFSNQIARKLRQFDALGAKDPNNISRIKEEILKEFLVKSLTLDWARAQNITINDTQLNSEVEKLRANYPDDLSFRRALAQQNISFSDWREDLRYLLIEKEVFKKLNDKIKPPSDSEIKAYFESNKNRFKRKEQLYIRQIVIDDEAKVEAIKRGLKTAEFSEYAKKYSITPEGKQGGVVGWIEKGAVDYFDALFSSGPSVQTIKSPFGIHLVKVEKKMPARIATLEEVRPQIVRAINAQREQAEYVAWLDAQLRSSKVLRNSSLIEAIQIETRGTGD